MNQWLPVADFFRVALVVHVDLSVLVWFIAIAGMLWSLNSAPRGTGCGLGRARPRGAGAALMSLAPFVGRGEPIMANYIPVLDAAAVPLRARGVRRRRRAAGAAQPVARAPASACRSTAAARCASASTQLPSSAAVALLAFALVLRRGAGDRWPARPTTRSLFWGGGHALQFTWTLLMLVAWLWLASACGARVPPDAARRRC